MSALSPHSYTISGVPVHFPCKAYPSQVAMMNHIIRALQRGHNALLESPTGSGKSLALLCASLAWQQVETRKAIEYNQAVDSGVLPAEFVHLDANGDVTQAEYVEPEDPNLQAAIDVALAESLPSGGFVPTDDSDDFVTSAPPAKRARPPDPASPPLQPAVMRKVKKKTVPKIYFGTRTHKQITQIIRELNKTPYRDCKMTILASRDHTCIHPQVSRMKSRNEGCKELNDTKKAGGGCVYRSAVKSKLNSHHALTAYRGTRDAWDIEDIVKVGQKARACPYYAVRELKIQAQIVFCPYNYLVEPAIRKSMDISLKGQIVILDEAHNIEDSARSAASWQVTQDDLREAMQDLEKLIQNGIPELEAHREMAHLCSRLSVWIDSSSQNLTDYTDYASASKVWTGTEIVALFNVHGIGQDKYGYLMEEFAKVAANFNEKIDNSEERADPEVPSLHSNSMSVLEGFFMILNYLYMNNMRHLNDYRVALVRTQSRKAAKPELGTWMSKRKGGKEEHKFTFTANFWCLNPAVTFEELKNTIHSIILTSGTLSPMASFSSELDVRFPLKLEANHVIDKRQVWIRTLSHGPTGHSLNATFRNAESFGFQDEMGRLTHKVCETIAHGILLFLPSYAMLNKLRDRWQQTGAWEQMGRKKVLITEPRFSDEFEASIKHFYDVIEATNSGPDPASGVDGALFMAVCRGKVSEGLDFADNNARVVICVGIPFPNFKDIQVDLKKKYNDQRKVTHKDILSGNDWYEIQAFRALNQALGRCIRHRRDWGGILMVDDRYQKIQRYIGSLSKWVRSGVEHYKSFDGMLSSLEDFNKDMKVLDQEHKAQEPPPPPPPTDPDLGSWAALEKVNRLKRECREEIARVVDKPSESAVHGPPPAAKLAQQMTQQAQQQLAPIFAISPKNLGRSDSKAIAHHRPMKQGSTNHIVQVIDITNDSSDAQANVFGVPERVGDELYPTDMTIIPESPEKGSEAVTLVSKMGQAKENTLPTTPRVAKKSPAMSRKFSTQKNQSVLNYADSDDDFL